LGSRAWAVSGNWRVVLSGTDVSGALENTGSSLAARRFSAGALMARLEAAASCAGLMGCTYWYTTYRTACCSGQCWLMSHSSATCNAPAATMACGDGRWRGSSW